MAGFRDRRALQRLNQQQQAVEAAIAQAGLAVKRVSAAIETGYMLVASYDGAEIAEQVVGLTATQTLTNKTLTTPILSMSTVAGLPGSPSAGMIALVTDANATTQNSVVAGSGSNTVLVFYDGTNWRIA